MCGAIEVENGPLTRLLRTGEAVDGPIGRHGAALPTGFAALDRLLPAGGVRRGGLVEWLAADESSPATTLACAVACRLARAADADGGAAASTIIVVDRRGRFYPPAVLGWLEDRSAPGRSPPRVVVARPSCDADEVWAVDQALRCRGVATVLAWPRNVHPTAMRRWQLAARASLAVGMFVRPSAARREPSWADARLAVAPLPGGSLAVRRLQLALAGGPWSAAAAVRERSVEVALDLASGCEAGHARTSPEPRILGRERVACRAS